MDVSGGGGSGGVLHSNCFIKNLPPNVSEQTLLSLFQQHGTVVSLRVFNTAHPAGKAPFAFVKMSNFLEAQKAITALHGCQLAGHVLEVKLADADLGQHPQSSPPPSDNLYVKGLNPGFSDDDLRGLFAPYGLVISTKVLHYGDQSGQGGAALVRMAALEEASAAVMSLNGTRMLGPTGGHPLVVRFADSADIKARKQAKQAVVQQQQAQHQVLATQGPLRYAYAYTSVDPQGGTPILGGQALGIIPSLSPAPATMAYQTMGSAGTHDLYGNPTGGSVMVANNSSGHQPSAATLTMGMYGSDPTLYMADATAVVQPSGQLLGPSGVRPGAMVMAGSAGSGAVSSLYVRNLPDNADKLYLYEKFSPFGPILSVKILLDDMGKSKCAGFVNYADPLCASKAQAALHNLPLGDRTLHVAFQSSGARPK